MHEIVALISIGHLIQVKYLVNLIMGFCRVNRKKGGLINPFDDINVYRM